MIFAEDVVGSEALMQRVGENYKKIRSTFRYILGNLGDFDAAVASTTRWKRSTSTCCDRRQPSRPMWNAYEEFAFHKIYHRLIFCIVDLSTFYFDVLKDALSVFAPKSKARRSAQIWHIGEALSGCSAPPS